MVEYGSSFPAMRAVGARQAIRDTIFGMSGEHLSPGRPRSSRRSRTPGLEPAAINFTCYRGRTRHPIKLPALARRNRWYEAVYGPTHFFYFNLFESERTGAPLAIRSRLEGSIDEYAAAVGRWLVTRDAFDFLVFYLPDYDYASHLAGPGRVAGRARAHRRRARAAPRGGRRRRRVPRALRGRRHLRSRPDPGRAGRSAPGRVSRRSDGVLALASNRAGMVYRLPGCRLDARALAERLDDEPGRRRRALPGGRRGGRRRDGAELASPSRGRVAAGGRRRRARPRALSERARARLACGSRRPPATCSSRRPRAGSSRTAAGGTMPAAAATARSSPATPTCR